MSRSVLRFGAFELYPGAGELRRRGDVVKLAPQPFKVLELLARRSGEVVTRAEIRDHVWSGDTFVDFEQGLNFCIRQIREVLGDTADAPRFIETLPRRGYRFLMPVTDSAPAAPARVTRLIVLPFRMLRPDPETEFLAFSLPDALTSSLGGLQSLVVRSSMTAARFAGDAVDPEPDRGRGRRGRDRDRHAAACRRRDSRHHAAHRRLERDAAVVPGAPRCRSATCSACRTS